MAGEVKQRKTTEGIVIHRAEVWSDEYHFVIEKDGYIRDVLPLNIRGAHAVAYNSSTVGIAVFGDFARAEGGENSLPTAAQIDSLVLLCRGLAWWYGKPLWIKGHTELGPSGTRIPEKLSYAPDHSCPGLNFPLDAVRARVQALLAQAESPQVS